jgi:hypothetical protein
VLIYFDEKTGKQGEKTSASKTKSDYVIEIPFIVPNKVLKAPPPLQNSKPTFRKLVWKITVFPEVIEQNKSVSAKSFEQENQQNVASVTKA